jgi:hypothetical protein
LAVIDVAGYVADLKDHAVGHGFHIHDERHFLETYSLRQNWGSTCIPRKGAAAPSTSTSLWRSTPAPSCRSRTPSTASTRRRPPPRATSSP